MPRFSPMDLPHSLRCLRAIVGYVGGVEALSNVLDIDKNTINRWLQVGEISKSQILPLTKIIMNNKFTAEELLGKYDDIIIDFASEK